MLIRIKNKLIYFQLKALNSIRLQKSKKVLKKYHNSYIGQRCFIVGNGPSLCTEDLNKLRNEICFGTHRVFNIFDKTNWRPNFYCAQDSSLIFDSIKEIETLDADEKFIAIIKDWKNQEVKDATYLNLINNEFYPDLPDFSTDITNGIFEGFTVSYMCLQIAMYMGFKEIYLIGIDHQYSRSLLPDGKIAVNESFADHFSEKDTLANIPQLYKSELSYVAAKKYADKHNIKIFNATRGGALEVFERVDLDTLF